jgi:DNA-binding transcriptional LysR family regulator
VQKVEQIEKDMIALPIGPRMRMAAVASPSYFKSRPVPKSPKQLTQHVCINLRLPTYGGLYVWEFERAGRELHVRVDGQLTFNTASLVLEAALDGFGVAYLPDDLVESFVKKKRLIRVLEEWSPPFPGYHLYYPSRRQQSPAFALVIDALRYDRVSAVR